MDASWIAERPRLAPLVERMDAPLEFADARFREARESGAAVSARVESAQREAAQPIAARLGHTVCVARARLVGGSQARAAPGITGSEALTRLEAAQA